MKIYFNHKYIEADVADNWFKHFIGLSFSSKKNMLFIMPYEAKWYFWMFAVSYPLKIVFINRRREVVDIKNAKPLSFDPSTWRTYKPRIPCQYVLETPFNLKFKIGDKLKW